MLKSNIAACHLNLKDWKAAVKSATEALESLDKLKDGAEVEEVDEGKEEADEEIVSEGAKRAEKVQVVKSSRKDDIERIRAKALMRRARARAESGGWSSLQGAEEGMSIYPSSRFNMKIKDKLTTQITKLSPSSPTSPPPTAASSHPNSKPCLPSPKQLKKRKWAK